MLFWKKLMCELFGPGHKPPPKATFRPQLEPLEKRENPAPVTYVWNAPADGPWNVAANWVAGVAGQYPGQGNDDVAEFSNGSNAKCTLTAPLPNALDGLLLAGGFAGTVQLNSRLTVTGTVDSSLLTGIIDQPNGGGSDLTFGAGVVNWNNTVINSTGTRSDLVINSAADLKVKTGAAIGDNILNSGKVEFMTAMSKAVTFNNNGGISNNIGASLLFQGAWGISTTGTGVITNDGTVKQTGTIGTVNVDLPLVNTNDCSYLEVDSGLTFTRAGQQTAVSVQQNAGDLVLVGGATLTVNYGYVQNAGTLQTLGVNRSYIVSGGQGPVDVAIHGGLLQLHDFTRGNYLGLGVTGFVTMDGGTWEENVDVTGGDVADSFTASKGFLLGGSSSLYVSTAGTPGKGDTLPIMSCATGSISGNFGTTNFDPMVWSAGVDPTNNKRYILTSTT
ncbi:MAG TPA: hypothetical protein VFE78_04330 [Gemmataceae bacterium]|jgi:hypothetical protein|nr:hypothetical protein [Gemmataceae bacterium]